MRRLLLLSFAAETSSEKQTAACLLGHRAVPPLDQPCTEVDTDAEADGDGVPSCLRTAVPAWTVPHARVLACFRCCIHSALVQCGLLPNFPPMLDLLENRSFNPWWNGRFDPAFAQHRQVSSWGAIKKIKTYSPTSALLSDFAFLRMAHIAVGYFSSTWVKAPRAQPPAHCAHFTLAVVQGWTAKHPDALGALHTELRQRKIVVPLVLLVMGDQYLPEVPIGATAQRSAPINAALLAAPELVAYGVHNPNPAAVSMTSKVFAFPRGVHDTASWQDLLARPENQAAQLVRDRKQLLHCSCINNFRHPARREKMQALRANGFDCNEHCPHGSGNWYALRSRFTFSPRGNSAQNFRDWEALLAGSIPLIDYDPATAPLFDGLPVVVVHNWSNVTPRYLNVLWRKMRERQYSWERLYLPYWLARLLALKH